MNTFLDKLLKTRREVRCSTAKPSGMFRVSLIQKAFLSFLVSLSPFRRCFQQSVKGKVAAFFVAAVAGFLASPWAVAQGMGNGLCVEDPRCSGMPGVDRDWGEARRPRVRPHDVLKALIDYRLKQAIAPTRINHHFQIFRGIYRNDVEVKLNIAYQGTELRWRWRADRLRFSPHRADRWIDEDRVFARMMLRLKW